MEKGKIRKFDTKIQYHKYKVLKEVAKEAWNGTLAENAIEIPERIVPHGAKPTMRCCVYKERAILQKRVKIAMGGKKELPNVIEVIKIACDECPMGGYEVTNACRGCMAHRCEDACRMGAITFDNNHVAHIDKSKCVECGACSKVCPYNAISDHKRPCKNACKVDAISITDDYTACIDYSKCISCGACVYQCPFGAIMDKSYIVEAIDILKDGVINNKKVFAVVAPAISSQFTYAKLGQVIKGIKNLGFSDVVEAALGADMVAYDESKELAEREFLTSSCCPAFVDYIHKQFPNLVEHISDNLSPAAKISKYIKENNPDSKVIFIGPCTAKKMEYKKEELKKYIDSVITFEELQALFDSRGVDITQLEEEDLSGASYFGRIFARSGGVSDAISQAIKEQGLTNFNFKPVTCNGIEECRIALLKASKNRKILDGNFIEGMACSGGCIGGAGCLTHGAKSKVDVDKYGKQAMDKTISDSINSLK
ncbi:MAG: 4Fe-4S dicluster domain-containing protein [Oscillospiraceae bacterium]|nr:4Fe-4S dicluster domain-containing protein [Oscillospiraceae bacterium]